MKPLTISKEEIVSAINSTSSMAAACAIIGCHISTFKRHALSYGVYKPNAGRKGHKRTKNEYVGQTIPIEEILNGLHPQYQTYKLKQRLYSEGIKSNVCEQCGTSSWNGKKLECELDHIDGNSKNHKLYNLRILCPNCHSQTDTFRFKRGKK